MAKKYDIKWQKDLLAHIPTFSSFAFEGNVHDLHPFFFDDKYEYLPLAECVGRLLKDQFCVVFYDHTKQAGKQIPDKNPENNSDENSPKETTGDDSMFNSFTFLEKNVVDENGTSIPNPNIELFKKYYRKAYVDQIKGSADQSLQGGMTMDMRRIRDAMIDYRDNVKVEYQNVELNGVKAKKAVYNSELDEYKGTKPFLFVLPNVSRYMTRPGDPDGREHALLMMLYESTQLNDNLCRVVLFVDKMNDLPTWFEAEDNNSAMKKVFIPHPNADFRETYYELEIEPMMKKIEDNDTREKGLLKFSAFTDNYSLRRLEQLKMFIFYSNNEEDTDLLKIDKTVFKFEYGQNEDPWRSPKMFEKLNGLEPKLNDAIKGQSHVTKQIVQTLRAAVAGVNSSKKNDRRPKAVFFLAGPTGTGKTEMCRTLAKELFGKEDKMIRFDMSEFREAHNESRLFGAPPGYIGYEAGGELTKAIKENPFSVLLFDEIEKASAKIWDKFLQILGDGRVTDGKGETVYFSQCVIVFTSNLGITAIKDKNKSEGVLEENDEKEISLLEKYDSLDEKGKEEARKELKQIEVVRAAFNGVTVELSDDKYFALEAAASGKKQWTCFCEFTSELVKERITNYFENLGRREILGRIGEANILVYRFIEKDVASRAIAEKTIKDFVTYLRDDNDISLDLDVSDKRMLDFIFDKVNDNAVLNLGGRGIRMTVEKLISEPVGNFIFTKAEEYAKSGEEGPMPRLKGKLVLNEKGTALVVID